MKQYTRFSNLLTGKVIEWASIDSNEIILVLDSGEEVVIYIDDTTPPEFVLELGRHRM